MSIVVGSGGGGGGGIDAAWLYLLGNGQKQGMGERGEEIPYVAISLEFFIYFTLTRTALQCNNTCAWLFFFLKAYWVVPLMVLLRFQSEDAAALRKEEEEKYPTYLASIPIPTGEDKGLGLRIFRDDVGTACIRVIRLIDSTVTLTIQLH